MNWRERLEYNKQILDNLPIENYMYPGQDVYDLMDMLKDTFEPFIQTDEVLEGELFSEYDYQDFAIYLEKRYGIPIIEHISYKIGWYKE